MRMRRIATLMIAVLFLLTGCGDKGVNAVPSAEPAVLPPSPEPGPEPVPEPEPAVGAVPVPTDPEAAQLAYRSALDLIAKGEMGAAVASLERAVALNPTLAEAWNDLSYALLRQNPYEHPAYRGGPGHDSKAVAAAQKALELKPDWAFAQYNLGLALLADANYGRAVEPLQRSAEQQPDRPEPLVALGLALIGAGRADEAIPFCRAAEAMETEFLLGAACLELAGDGYPRLNESEAELSPHVVPDNGAAAEAEFIRISPPFTCATDYHNGHRVSYFGCYGDGPTYRRSYEAPYSGKTPAGVGIGTPMDEVTARYGGTYSEPGVLRYRVGDQILTISGNQRDGVTRMVLRSTTPVFVIDDLIHDRTGAAPSG